MAVTTSSGGIVVQISCGWIGHLAQQRRDGSGSHHPSSVSMALNPRAARPRNMVVLPVPDIPVSKMRFTPQQPTSPDSSCAGATRAQDVPAYVP